MVDTRNYSILEEPVVYSPFRGSLFAKCTMRGTPPPHPTLLGFPRTKYGPYCPVVAPSAESLARRHALVDSRTKILKTRNARQTAATNRSIRVVTRQRIIIIHGERVKIESVRGGAVKSPSRGPLWRKNVTRGSPPPHPARLGSPGTKYIPISTVSVSNAGIFEAPA
jgi:hypothetical protein